MLFEVLDQITRKKEFDFIKKMDEGERKKISPYIVNRFLSMRESFIPLSDYFNQYTFNFSLEQFYQISRYVIPKFDKKVFFKYIKAGKKGSKKKPKWLIEIISEEFMVSQKEAREYIDILLFKNKNDLISILKKYPLEDKKYREIGLNPKELFQVSKKKEIVEDIEPEKIDKFRSFFG